MIEHAEENYANCETFAGSSRRNSYREFLGPLGITKHQLAIDLGVPASRMDQIAKGKRSISADTAMRLSIYVGNSPQFWMNLQSAYDLEMQEERLPEIRRQVRDRAA